MKPIEFLMPPLLTDENIDTKIVCIRAHRERIFRVEHEKVGNQHVFHNYGQAGAGWTFLFGCIATSLEQFTAHNFAKNTPITIVGAGCYGLLTAYELHRLGYSVTIVAERYFDIPSEKAAGFFFPRPRRTSTPHEIARFESAGLYSYKTYLAIAEGAHPFLHEGAQIVPAYYDREIDPGFTPYIHAGLVDAPIDTKVTFDGHRYYDLIRYRVISIDACSIMKQLRTLVHEVGITCVQRTVAAWSELDTSIVFNCSGMGSKLLVPDKGIIPVQGHLITLCNQSQVDQLQYMVNVRVPGVNERGIPRNDLIYFAPKGEGVLGITFLRGQDSLHTNHHEFDRLLERSRRFFMYK